MHPAPSLIAFTTLSGLGLGMLAFLCLGVPDVTGWTAFVFFAVGFALAGGGLSASVLHLGHPERALMAFSEWRSSWLSREAWVACAALVSAGACALGPIFFDTRLPAVGVLAAALCLATVVCTAMIYTQLRTVPRWRHWSTPALFLCHALAGGALMTGQVTLAGVLLLALGAGQWLAWTAGDGRFAAAGSDLGTATGLGRLGTVRSFEAPHTGRNYLTTEMIHVVGRKHAATLRIVAVALMSVVPAAILLVLPFSHALAGVAVASHLAGALTGRWLFFAEAEHVVGLWYGRR